MKSTAAKKADEGRVNEEHPIEVPGAKLTIVARPTVRQWLRYRSASAFVDPADFIASGWRGVKKVIIKWESELVPEPELDIDDCYDPAVASLIQAVVLAVKGYYADLEEEKKQPRQS